ncbi:uncharacterized protein LOC131936565 [Physella acuta]|uniref:uncharacterized protein LOC131936565 n=1 Tax=Physella acuta TaxID=109671 RepID=UPI0027DB9E64|nr:uncharacterized protein LOC131936565 [Physella acuta]
MQNPDDSYEHEADNDHMLVTLILPNGEVKSNFVVRTKTNVLKEKKRILFENQLSNDFSPEDLKLFILLKEGNEIKMDENENMSFYREQLTAGQLELKESDYVPKNSVYPTSPQEFGLKLK